MPDLLTTVETVKQGLSARGVSIVRTYAETMPDAYLIRVACSDGDEVQMCVDFTGPRESQLDHAADTLNFAGV